MNKVKIAIASLALSLIPYFGFSQSATISEQLDKLGSLIKAIDYNYVDSVDNEKLVEKAIIGMLAELDPHSVYIPKEEVAKMNEPLIGNFEGIGIRFNVLHDTIIVISPITGGPSERLGIRPGDKIVRIEDENVAGIGIKNSAVMDKLRGKKGTKVNIGVLRRGNKNLIDYAIIRDKIPLYSVDASYMATPTIGYIKVSRFARDTDTEFTNKIIDLKKQGLKHLILDLRGNGGGYLETAFKMADEFLDQNKMIVYTEGLKHHRQEYKATSKGNLLKGKLVILIDEGSASASEIVSGAIQDWDRGLIIGRKSFGKGLVQKPFYLPDGSSVRLTTARYYTPSGRCIQKPYDGDPNDYQSEVNARVESGELFLADSIKFPDSLKFKTHADRVVFGGGGIMPDIFVPLDTMEYSDYYSDLVRKGMFNEFTLTYLDNHRDELKKTYLKFSDFNTGFNAETELLDQFIEYAANNDIERNDDNLLRSKDLINIQLKALLAQNLWGSGEYYEVINSKSNAFTKAIESIEGDAFNRSKLSYK